MRLFEEFVRDRLKSRCLGSVNKPADELVHLGCQMEANLSIEIQCRRPLCRDADVLENMRVTRGTMNSPLFRFARVRDGVGPQLGATFFPNVYRLTITDQTDEYAPLRYTLAEFDQFL